MKLVEVDIGETDDTKRKAIEDNVGSQMILYDAHELWVHALIITYDSQAYQVRIADNRQSANLYYHDLQKLIALAPGLKNSLPEFY